MKEDKNYNHEYSTTKHLCTLNNNDAIIFQTDLYLSSFRHTLKIWKNNPSMKYFYRNLTDIEEECKLEGFIVHPFSFFLYAWEHVQLFILLIGLFITPLNYIYGKMLTPTLVQIGFSNELESFEILVDFSYLANFILMLFTGFVDAERRKVYMTPRKIWRHRIRSVIFYIDIISVISATMFVKIYIDYFRPEENLSWIIYVKLISLTKMMRMVRFAIYFKLYRQHFDRWKFIPVCFKFTVLGVVFLHTLTCISIMANQHIEMFHKNEDLTVYSFEMDITVIKPFSVMYGNAYEYILATALRIRQGARYIYLDTNMFTYWLYNLLTHLLVTIIGLIIAAFVTVLLVQIILIMNASEIKYHGVINELVGYLILKRVPKTMERRIIQYYNYRFAKSYYNKAILNENLSETIIRNIYLHSRRALIDVVPILKELQQEVRDELITYLGHQIYLYSDVIINAGDADNCMYFISRGSVAVYTPSGHEICHLQDGAYFGEIALLLPGEKRVATVAAIEICEVYRLDRDVFFKCVDDSSQFYKKLEHTARQRHNKTNLLEELHQKYLFDRSTKRRHERRSSVLTTSMASSMI